MNYQGIYDHIIANAKVRSISKEEYTERHHIIPKSLGGSNRKDNIVRLYPREHFVCHLLLAKIHPKHRGMQFALFKMSRYKKYKVTGRLYEKIREEYAKFLSADVERASIISEKLKGVPKSPEHIKAWKESRKQGAGWVCSDEKKMHLSQMMVGENNPNYGKPHTEESVRKIKEANEQKIECPYCANVGGIAIMKRWHFDNCKKSPTFQGRKKYPTFQCPHCGLVGGGPRMKSDHFDNCKARQ